MVRKTKKRKRVKTQTHPGHNPGWLVLRKRWQQLRIDFFELIKETIAFYIESKKKRFIWKWQRFGPRKWVVAQKKSVVRFYKHTSKRYQKTKLHAFVEHYQPELLMGIGVLLMSMFVIHWWNTQATLRQNKQVLLMYNIAPIKEVSRMYPRPKQIKIPGFVETSITDGIVANNFWTISDTTATYLTQSAKPGQKGNVIIYGHNTWPIFAGIRSLSGGELIQLELTDGSIRTYVVTETAQVSADSMQYLAPTQYELLTLYTCAGWADSERFIVRALPEQIVTQLD
jgi:hypothetical protein